MNWSSTDGKSWSKTVGDNQATVWLINEVSYLAAILWIDGSSTVLEGFDCIKEAKKACLDEIERVNAQEETEELSAMFRESDPNIDDGMPA